MNVQGVAEQPSMSTYSIAPVDDPIKRGF